MFKLSKHTLVAATVIAAASAPASASAMLIGGEGPEVAAAPPVYVNETPFQQTQLAAIQRAVTKQFGNTSGGLAGPVAKTSGSTGQAATSGFQWDDAGIGAAGMLGLLGAAGATTVLARRRRDRHTAAV